MAISPGGLVLFRQPWSPRSPQGPSQFRSNFCGQCNLERLTCPFSFAQNQNWYILNSPRSVYYVHEELNVVYMNVATMDLTLYNTKSRQKEKFVPLNDGQIGLYACGPTVYDYQHIGHMRRYVGDDILVRTLKEANYSVKHVMNITDVGHLVSDQDTGEDKMEKGAEKFRLSIWDLAKKFEKQFFDSEKALNINKPDLVMRATDYIKEQIELIKTLSDKGYTYIIEDGVYFDTSKFSPEEKLTSQKPGELKAGVRVKMTEGKRNPTDFALWKFSPRSGKKREMEWNSPWGIGFPGWHIECSAMSMKALGPTIDIHTGGMDHIAIHHTDEIIQSEAATGKPFARYWVHHGFLLVNGEKMSKSKGNFYTVENVLKKGFDPLALRYLYLQTHYRQEMNFTWEALKGAQSALQKLYAEVSSFGEPKIGCAEFEGNFFKAVSDDLNMPQALAVVWELVKSNYPGSAKAESLLKFDKILGLGLGKYLNHKVPQEVQNLLLEREKLRGIKDFSGADKVRVEIEKLGYLIEDTLQGEKVIQKK